MKNAGTKRERTEYNVQSVSNAISILEVLGGSEHEQSITEIQDKLNLTKSNVNKLLATLEQFGYVENNLYTGNFRLGVKTFQISQSYMSKLKLQEVSIPVLRALRDKVHESAYISVLRKGSVVYLSSAETEATVRVIPKIGNVDPAYATAVGKVQLAALDNTEIEQYYSSELVKLNDKDLPTMDVFVSEIIKIREQGYAIDEEIYNKGVSSVAAPIKDFMGNVIASISINAPSDRMGKERIENDILPEILKSAQMLSVKFGYKAAS